jgi:hypothetical protein
MKYKLIILTVLLLSISNLKSQEALYSVITKQIQLEYSGLLYNNKLLCVSYLSNSPSNEEWEALKEFNRTLEVFKYAKLKGGESGIIWVLLCDEYSEALQLELEQHGILNPFLLHCSLDISSAQSAYNFEHGNILFDKSGNLLYSKLPVREIFNTIHTKIIR